MREVLANDTSCEPVSALVYADFELECPFCECSRLSINSVGRDTEYRCFNCGGEWNVLEK